MSLLDSFARGAGSSDLLNQITESFFSTDYLKDYGHASELMRPNGLALAPKQKYLFHVFFSLQHPTKYGPEDKGLLGALVKSAQLPSFSLDTEEYVQYNRKRLVHNRIKYEPITIKFYDDSSDTIRQLWHDYYTYHFADATYDYSNPVAQAPNGKADYNGRDIYNHTIPNQVTGWGKTVSSPDGKVKLPFFKDIVIYGMSRGNYMAYTLINPVITAWRHDTYDYSAGGDVMEHEVQLQYEAVKYSSGKIEKSNDTDKQSDLTVKGFATKGRYDKVPGALGPGATRSVFGQGGIEDSLTSIGADLASGNWLGAARTAGAAAETFGTIDTLSKVVTEDVSNVITDSAIRSLGTTVNGLSFPSINLGTPDTSVPSTPREPEK